MAEQVRVVRIIEYCGDKAWVDRTIARSLTGTLQLDHNRSITTITLGESNCLPNLRAQSAKELPGISEAVHVSTGQLKQAARRLASTFGMGDVDANAVGMFNQLCQEFGIKIKGQ